MTTIVDTGRLATRPARRAVSLLVVLVLALVVVGWMGPARPAYASGGTATVPDVGEVATEVTKADKLTMPASIIASLLGETLPATRAFDSISYQIENFENQGGVVGDVDEGLSIVQHVPGFKLGEKVGGYIDSLLGLDITPDSSFVPYAGENVQSTPQGFVGKNNGTITGTNYYGYKANGVGVTYGYVGAASFASCSIATETGCAAIVPAVANPVGTTTAPDGQVLAEAIASGLLRATNGSYQTCVEALRVQLISQGGHIVVGHASGSSYQNRDGYAACRGSGIQSGTLIGYLWSVQQGGATYPTAPTYTGGCTTKPAIYGGGACPTDKALSYYLGTDVSGSPPGSSDRPLRQWWMTGHCADGTELDQGSASFHEDDTKLPPFPPPPKCGDHGILLDWELDLNDLSLNKIKMVQKWSAPDDLRDLVNQHPECLGGGACAATLWKASSRADGTVWEDCFESGDDACDGWATDPDRSTKYSCTYGQGDHDADTDVGISGCNAYGPTFNRQKRAQGKVYSDPAQDPGASNGGKGETDNDPAAPIAKTDPGTDGSTVSEPCFPSGWGVFNPVNWVLQPVKCALTWAFVPDEAKLAALEGSVKNSFDELGASAWFDAFGSFYGQLGGSGSGCMGPHVVWTGKVDFYPFAACDEPMATVATIFRDIVTLVIIMAGLRSGMRAIGSAFGFNFGMGHNEPAEA